MSSCELLPGSPFRVQTLHVQTTRRRNPVWPVGAGWLRVSGWLHKSGGLYISAGVIDTACSAGSDRVPRIGSRVRTLRTACAAGRRDSHYPTAVMHIGSSRSTESIENDGAALTPIFPHKHPLDYRVEPSRGLAILREPCVYDTACNWHCMQVTLYATDSLSQAENTCWADGSVHYRGPKKLSARLR